jgi:hydroxymethylbilane synthase
LARNKLRIASRNTESGRRRAAAVAARLEAEHEGLEIEIQEMPSDAVLDAVAAGAADLHVCAARELPVDLPEGVEIAGCTERRDAFDVLITPDGAILEDLPDDSELGVDSARVGVQIGAFREELKIRKLDQPVELFPALLERGEVAGLIVTAEDAEILGWQDAVSEVFPPDILLPAAGQGSLAMLTRSGDPDTPLRVAPLDHEITRQVVAAERAFLRELQVRPSDPVGVHGAFEEDTLVLEALLGDEISGAILRDDLDGEPAEEADLGVRLAKLFIADGARDYLAGYK